MKNLSTIALFVFLSTQSLAGEDDSKDPNVSGPSQLDTSLGYNSDSETETEEDVPPTPNSPMTTEEQDQIVLMFAHRFAAEQEGDHALIRENIVQHILGIWRHDGVFTPRALALLNAMDQAANNAAVLHWAGFFPLLFNAMFTPQLDALFEAWLAEVTEERRLHLRNPVPENFTLFEAEPESPQRSPRNFGGGSPTR